MPRSPVEQLQNLGELVEKKFQELWPFLSQKSFVETLDVARRIFFERLNETLEKLAEECVNQALSIYAPEPKKKRPGRAVEHTKGRVWADSIIIAQWLEMWGVPITKSLMAVAYYREIDLSRADQKNELLRLYDGMKQKRRDQYSRDYDKLLISRKLVFEELRETGREAGREMLSRRTLPLIEREDDE
jgi:hypothetical protein